MSNIKFSYLYRDGSNFKRRRQIVFGNPQGLACDEVTKILLDEWGEDGLFLAHQIRVPEVFLYGEEAPNADDHCFHEFDEVGMSEEIPSDRYGRTIIQFIAEIQSPRGRNWTVFDPFDRALREELHSPRRL